MEEAASSQLFSTRQCSLISLLVGPVQYPIDRLLRSLALSIRTLSRAHGEAAVVQSLGNSTYDFFFSVKTGLLVRFDTDQHVPNGTSSVSIRNYRLVDKVLFAFGAAQTAGRVKWTRKLTEVKFDEPIDESIFLKPEKTGPN